MCFCFCFFPHGGLDGLAFACVSVQFPVTVNVLDPGPVEFNLQTLSLCALHLLLPLSGVTSLPLFPQDQSEYSLLDASLGPQHDLVTAAEYCASRLSLAAALTCSFANHLLPGLGLDLTHV